MVKALNIKYEKGRDFYALYSTSLLEAVSLYCRELPGYLLRGLVYRD